MLQAFVNIMPDEDELATLLRDGGLTTGRGQKAQLAFERDYGPIYRGATLDEYFSHADMFRLAWTAKPKSLERKHLNDYLTTVFGESREMPSHPQGRPAYRVDLEKHGKITIEPRDLLDLLARELLASKYLRVCRYRECPVRYFAAERHTQKFCCKDCAHFGENQRHLKWWKKNRGKAKKH
jgi:hypothetical protein